MGQKIHPIGLRLGIIHSHSSRWFASHLNYSTLLKEDTKIRAYITKQLASAGLAGIQLDRKAEQVEVTIRTARPGVVVGRGGAGIEKLRGELEKLLGRKQIRINVQEVPRADAEAALIAEYIASQLEKRVAFRRVIRQTIQRAQRAGVQGIKIMVAGRLNGAEIARTEWTREGRVPLHTLRADIDYAEGRAQTIYGVIGIKIWIFKGEVLPTEDRQATAPNQAPPKRRKKLQYDVAAEEGS
ncbi:30S ribosomal protein S3 [Candidatus Cyanaurora vandensis]|uniref:30S ribosomal protein S3 n=1 Tax=Candidatus Cyanaurora vandensis TaxID=2714958 RepID=UPI00257C9DB6|nr:30S ribosomal protein S3 [Candidatus Cyanaurora vandensis]